MVTVDRRKAKLRLEAERRISTCNRILEKEKLILVNIGEYAMGYAAPGFYLERILEDTISPQTISRQHVPIGLFKGSLLGERWVIDLFPLSDYEDIVKALRRVEKEVGVKITLKVT